MMKLIVPEAFLVFILFFNIQNQIYGALLKYWRTGDYSPVQYPELIFTAEQLSDFFGFKIISLILSFSH